LGGATLLVGNVPAARPAVAEPVALPATRTVEPEPVQTQVGDAPATPPAHPPVTPPPVAPPVEDTPNEAPPEPEPPTDPPSAGASSMLFFMPVDGVAVAEVPDTFGDPRGTGR